MDGIEPLILTHVNIFQHSALKFKKTNNILFFSKKINK